MNSGTVPRGYASGLVSVLIWALVPVGTRFFVQRVDPYLFNVIRFAAAGLVALPLLAYAKPWRWPARDQWLLLACAVLSVPGYNLPVALGARTVHAGELGIVIATEPVMIAALTVLIQRRPIQANVVGGSVIALFGVALTSGIFTGAHDFKLVGTLEVLAGALSWSLYTVLVGRLNLRHGAVGVTGAIIVLGSIVLIGLCLPLEGRSALPDRGTVAILAAMGVTTSLLGFMLWNHAARLVPPERLGLFLYLIPLVSVYVGAQFLAEPITLPMLLGGGLVIFGVWFASRRGPPRRLDARAAPSHPPV